MATSKATIKKWFKNGKKPNEEQFWAWMDAYWHKDEKLPVSAIHDLNTILSGKATTDQVEGLANSNASNLSASDIDAWKTILNVGDLPDNVGTVDDGQETGNVYTKTQIDALVSTINDSISENGDGIDDIYDALDGLGHLSEKDTIDDTSLLDDKVVSESKLSTNVQTKLNYSAPNKFDGTTAPTANDDRSKGWQIGSVWIDNTGEEAYRCIDNTNGAAVWVKTTLGTDELGDMALEDKADYYTKNHFGSAATKDVDTDVNLGSSDDKVPSQKAVKKYADDVQKQADWSENDSSKKSFIKEKPTEINFNIYNQTPNDKVIVDDTSETSIIAASYGTLSIENLNKDSGCIGKVFGRFEPNGGGETIKTKFTIGNREDSITVTNNETATMPFFIDYVINMTSINRFTMNGIIQIGKSTSFIHFSESEHISGHQFDISAELSDGRLSVYSSFLHRNVNI